jgi:hypothetical protein
MIKKYLFCTFFLFFGIKEAGAQSMPIPLNMQAALIKKIFQYDNALKGKEVVVGIVYSKKTSDVDNIIKSFSDISVAAKPIAAGQVNSEIGSVSVLYILPGVPLAPVKTSAVENKTLTTTGVPNYTEKGDISVAIGESGGKAQIIINASRLKQEGHTFSSNLLKLARVID